jgi:1-deoxy-D-xylulose-5-phosphate synthase
VILNDNQMSISRERRRPDQDVGAPAGGRTLHALREGGKKLLGDSKRRTGASPAAGKNMEGHGVPSTLFEEMGFNYTGPIDGHDIG